MRLINNPNKLPPTLLVGMQDGKPVVALPQQDEWLIMHPDEAWNSFARDRFINELRKWTVRFEWERKTEHLLASLNIMGPDYEGLESLGKLLVNSSSCAKYMNKVMGPKAQAKAPPKQFDPFEL